MPLQETSQLKEKIINRIRFQGPSLPVQIAKLINTDTLFASAFLSELISEKRLRLSNLRVGSSPLYFVPGQEHLLEKFGQHLRSKEREAFELLKENKILKDSEQHPAIRMALSQIKDFAIPFRKDGELYWRYIIVDQEKINLEREEQLNKKIPLLREIRKQLEEKPKEIITIEEKPKEEAVQEQTPKKKPAKKRKPKKADDKFFNKVKKFLEEKSIEILDLEGFSRNDLRLRIKMDGEEKLLVAYNKRKINELDIIKAHKKAAELNLKYMLLGVGEPSKKLDGLIDAVRSLSAIKKLE